MSQEANSYTLLKLTFGHNVFEKFAPFCTAKEKPQTYDSNSNPTNESTVILYSNMKVERNNKK